MAFTQSDLDAIERAIASGELTVRTDDRSITYRGMDELMKARDAIKSALAEASNAARGYPRHQLADFADDDE